MSLRALSVSPSDVLDLSDRLAVVIAAMRGDFKEEIAELKTERALMADDVAALGSKDAIAKKIADADAAAATIRADAEALKEAAKQATDKADIALRDAMDRLNEAAKREAAVSQAEARLSGEAEKRAVSDAVAASAFDAREKALAAREKEISIVEARVASARSTLNAERDAFNAKLAQLRA